MSKYNKKRLGSKNLTNILKNPDYDDFNILDSELEYIDTLFDKVCDNNFEDLEEFQFEKNRLKQTSNNAEKKYVDYEKNFYLRKENARQISNNIDRFITDEEYAKFLEDQRRYKIEYIFCFVIDEIKSYVKNMLDARTSFYSHQGITMSPKFNIIDKKIYKNIYNLYLLEKYP
jgi:hypothetical protein